MTNSAPKLAKERSKSFPVLPLKAAVERLQQFEKKFSRYPAPFEKAGLAWGMEEGSSQANRYLAALKSFGLLEYMGSGKDRVVSISEDGRTYLRAQQDSIKKQILKSAALRPKQIARFWPFWGIDRPPDEICIDELVLKHGFTESSAPQFLKVYDETIAYAGLSSGDKVSSVETEDEDDEEQAMHGGEGLNVATAQVQKPLPLEKGERILTTGLLAKDANFKLIVSGHVGPKEIDILIRKLELDKEILADRDEDDGGAG